MAFIVNSETESYILSSATELAGVEQETASTGPQRSAMYRIFSEIGAYINADFVSSVNVPEDSDVPRDKYGEPKGTVPLQIVDGVVIPMLAARLVNGMQSVSSISEGGSSASVTPTYSDKVGDYLGILCRFRRLGYPKNWGAV